MWLLRSTHKHIAQDTLNEYLDERLQDRALETVEQQLGECDACRLELEELCATVAMMQTLPMEAPRRSFVMSAPPPEPARAHPMLALRAPNWVYAGAASVAALAVTISVDATGGLSSDPAGQDAQVATLATSALSVAESESVAEDVTAAAAAPAPAASASDSSAPRETSGGAATFEAETALEAPQAPEAARLAEPTSAPLVPPAAAPQD